MQGDDSMQGLLRSPRRHSATLRNSMEFSSNGSSARAINLSHSAMVAEAKLETLRPTVNGGRLSHALTATAALVRMQKCALFLEIAAKQASGACGRYA